MTKLLARITVLRGAGMLEYARLELLGEAEGLAAQALTESSGGWSA